MNENKTDKKLEVTETDLLTVLEKNADTMNKMTNLLDNESKRNLYGKIVWAIAITIMVVAFLYCVSTSEPTVVQNNNTNRNVGMERNVEYVQ